MVRGFSVTQSSTRTVLAHPGLLQVGHTFPVDFNEAMSRRIASDRGLRDTNVTRRCSV